MNKQTRDEAVNQRWGHLFRQDYNFADHEKKRIAQHQLIEAPQEGERYQHYKGGFYKIICTSIKEDTLEPLVTYQSEEYKVNYTRTLDNWNAIVEWEGQSVSRFKKVAP